MRICWLIGRGEELLLRYSFIFFIFLGCVGANKDSHKKPTVISWPVGKLEKMSRGYKRGHHGIDIVGRRGTSVLAAHDGYVVYTGSGFSGYGKVVILDSGRGWSSLYAHLDHIAVKEKSKISRGDEIGKMGDSGDVTGVHLHFELMYNKKVLDPRKYLPKIR